MKPILIVGGGISGITSAVEAAEAGFPVVDRSKTLSRRTSNSYESLFSKNVSSLLWNGNQLPQNKR